jgi:ubiquinone/menaquinone biosynthesis C-methylase UbiE
MHSKSETERAASYYTDFSKRYDAERRAGYFGFVNDLEFNKIESISTGKRALEIGCGTGLILERTHEVARQAIGVDISPGMVEHCLAKGLDAQLIDGSHLPFDDDSFDLVYSFKVLAHVPNIQSLLSEIARVTKPGGRMVLEFYNPFSFKALNDWLRTRPKENPVYLRHDSLRAVRSYLPPGVVVKSTRGIRIFGPTAWCYEAPVLGEVTRCADRLACDSPLRKLGGYYVIELGFEHAAA